MSIINGQKTNEINLLNFDPTENLEFHFGYSLVHTDC